MEAAAATGSRGRSAAAAPTLADVRARLARLASGPARDAAPIAGGRWSAAQHLQHLTSTLRAPLDGFPQKKPAPVRFIARTFVLPRFLRSGRMDHDRNAPLPGMPEPDASRAWGDALRELEGALDAFARAIDEKAPLHPHAFFGALDHARYAAYNAIHLDDHLGVIDAATDRAPGSR